MAPTNGMVSYSSPVENGSYIYGTVATFSCFPSFFLDGTSTRTCETEQGTFSGTTPSCIGERIPSCTVIMLHQITAITCSALPGNVANGMIVYSTDITDPYNYGTTAAYECDTGYEITSGDNERTCTGNTSVGEWKGKAAVCSGTITIVPVMQCALAAKFIPYATAQHTHV